jgi:hypothetical protein
MFTERPAEASPKQVGKQKARALRRGPWGHPWTGAYEAVSAVTSARTFSARAVER